MKKSKWSILWISSFVFIVCQVDCYWNILKLSCRTYRAHIASYRILASYRAFLKNKRSRTSLPALFLLWRKIFVLLYFINKSNFTVLLSLVCEIMVCFNYLLTRFWGHKFWNQPCLSDQVVFFCMAKKQDKNLNILRTFKMK